MPRASQTYVNIHQARSQENENHSTRAYFKDDFRPERGPPQWDGPEPGKEAYERAVMPDVEREAMREYGRCKSICQFGEERAWVDPMGKT